MLFHNPTISTDLNVINITDYDADNIQSVSPIEAFFIPTLGKRDNIIRTVEILKEYSKYIYVLKSGHSDDYTRDLDVFIVDFNTEDHLRNINLFQSSYNPSREYNLNYDLPTKRNFAIQYGIQNGFSKIGLIDDDIIIDIQKVKKAAAILEKENANLVGYYSLNFPDKSAIDLVECKLKNTSPDVCLSGNCLFINLDKAVGFFPYVYNEDWMYIMGNIIEGKVVGAGTVEQMYHEPWNDLNRIAFEQFGDIIAFGARMHKIRRNRDLPSTVDFWSYVYDSYNTRLLKLRDLAIKQDIFIKQVQLAIDTVLNITPYSLCQFLTNYKQELNLIKDAKRSHYKQF